MNFARRFMPLLVIGVLGAACSRPVVGAPSVDQATPASAASVATPSDSPDGGSSDSANHGTADPAFALYGNQCADFGISPRRCTFIVKTLAEQAHVDPEDATNIELLGDPGCGDPPDPSVMCLRSTVFIVRARFTTPGGRVAEESVFCNGGSWLCEEAPEIIVPTMEGYHDIPCPGEPPKCPSPLPTIDPGDANRAESLHVDALDIPIDHLGEYDIVVGEATLPNGILTERTLGLADPKPTDFHLGTGLEINLVSLDDGKDVGNYWTHGWRAGTERVEAHLLFSVIDALPGAVLQVRDVEVR